MGGVANNLSCNFSEKLNQDIKEHLDGRECALRICKTRVEAAQIKRFSKSKISIN